MAKKKMVRTAVGEILKVWVKTAKKKTVKSAKKKTAKRQPNARTARVMRLLEKSTTAKTVREICQELKIPKKDVKFVASILVVAGLAGKLRVKDKTCSVTGRVVNAFALRKRA